MGTNRVAKLKAALKSKQFDNALEIIDAMISASGESHELLHDKGLIYVQMRNLKDALVCFERALELAPQSIPTLTNAAMACGHLELPSRALSYLEKALQLAPNAAKLWQLRGVALCDLSRFNEALTSFANALKIDPKYSQALVQRGIARLRLQDREGALSDFSTLTELFPEDQAGWALRGQVLREQGHYEEALMSFDRAIEINNGDPVLWNSRALLLGLQGKNREAEESARRALEIDPLNSNALIYLSKSLTDQGRFPEALQSVDAAIQIESQSGMALVLKADMLNRIGKTAEALDTARKASKRSPDSSYPWMIRASIHISAEKPKAALRAIAKAQKKSPQIPMSGKIKYGILLAMGKRRSRRAIKALLDYLHDHTQDVEAWNELGALKHRSRRFKQAAEAYAEAAKRDPENPLHRYNQAVALISDGQRATGISLLRGLSKSPHNFLPAESALEELDKLVRVWWWDWWFRDGHIKKLIGSILLMMTGFYLLLPTLSAGVILPLIGDRLNTGMSFQYYVLPGAVLLVLLLLPNIQKISRHGVELTAIEDKSRSALLPLQELASAASRSLESVHASTAYSVGDEWVDDDCPE
jgi:tetratricopeptide (TPR) repeat protein